MPFGTEVGLGPVHIVLMGTQQPLTFLPMYIVAKRSPISATADLLLKYAAYLRYSFVRCTPEPLNSAICSTYVPSAEHNVQTTYIKGPGPTMQLRPIWFIYIWHVLALLHERTHMHAYWYSVRAFVAGANAIQVNCSVSLLHLRSLRTRSTSSQWSGFSVNHKSTTTLQR